MARVQQASDHEGSTCSFYASACCISCRVLILACLRLPSGNHQSPIDVRRSYWAAFWGSAWAKRYLRSKRAATGAVIWHVAPSAAKDHSKVLQVCERWCWFVVALGYILGVCCMTMRPVACADRLPGLDFTIF